jgi:hypothetical protein
MGSSVRPMPARMPPRQMPPQIRRPISQQPQKSDKDSLFEDTMKKLREMSK